MARNSTLKIVIAVVAFLAIIIFLMYGSADLGLSAETPVKMVNVMPALIFFAIGCITLVKNGVSVFALPSFSALGIGMALLLGSIENFKIYPVTFSGGATLVQVQWIVIILTTMVGAIVAAMSRGRN
jgi:hypothetical protein